MKKLIILCLTVAAALTTYAQTTDNQLTGAQILRAARSIYDQGRLHELPSILKGAVNRHGKNELSKSEKIEAYKLLILTYIYLEEPKDADENMIALLKTDHFFEAAESDPVEFRSLLKKFRDYPLFSIGVKLSLDKTYVNTISYYYIPSEAAGKGTYTPNVTLNYGLVFERDWKRKVDPKKKTFIDKLVIAPELFLTKQSFTYNNTSLYFDDASEITASNSHNIVQSRAALNALLRYKLGTSSLNPYVTIGPSVGYLTSSSFKGQSFRDNKDIKTGAPIDNTDHYKSLDVSAIAGAGIRYKLSEFYITIDVRYQFGFFNVVNKNNRNKLDTANDREIYYGYTYVDNDFSISQAMVNVGFSYPIFNPKKLVK